MTLAQRIHALMKDRGVGYSEAARRAGHMKLTTFREAAKGITVSPGVEVVGAIAKGFGVPVSWLYGEGGDEVPKPQNGAPNRAHALILKWDAEAGDQPPDISILLEEAAEAGFTAEELEEILRRAVHHIRRRATTALPTNEDPKHLATAREVENRARQLAQPSETTTPLNDQRRLPKEARANLGVSAER